MAVTIAVQETAGQRPSAPTFTERMDVTGDASYPTSGYDLGLDTLFPGRTVVAVQANPSAVAAAPFARFDYGTGFLLFIAETGIEVANAVNVAAATFEVIVTFK